MRLLAIMLCAVLVACTQTPTPSKNAEPASLQSVMNRVSKSMNACWYRAKDKALRGTTMAPELNSLSGKPRILIVPRNNPGGLPKLVVEAQRVKGKTELSVFGPLVDTKDGPRLVKTVRKWARGETVCA